MTSRVKTVEEIIHDLQSENLNKTRVLFEAAKSLSAEQLDKMIVASRVASAATGKKVTEKLELHMIEDVAISLAFALGALIQFHNKEATRVGVGEIDLTQYIEAAKQFLMIDLEKFKEKQRQENNTNKELN